jgi:hypothetical protein
MAVKVVKKQRPQGALDELGEFVRVLCADVAGM